MPASRVCPSRQKNTGLSLLSATPPSDTTVAIALPREYTAFCLLHQNAYHRYALHRLRDRDAALDCVEGALGELVTMWPAVLSSQRPSAVAWRVLRAWVGATGCVRHPSFPGALSPAQADAVLLGRDLGFAEAKVASVMGLEEATVAVYLRTAERGLLDAG